MPRCLSMPGRMAVAASIVLLASSAWAQVQTVLKFESDPSQDFRTVAYSQDDRYIVATDYRAIAVWEASSGKQVYSSDKALDSVAFNRGGNALLFREGSGKTLQALDLDGLKVRTVLEDFDDCYVHSSSLDGRYIACMKSGAALVYDLQTKKQVFSRQFQSLTGVELSPDGKMLAIVQPTGNDAVLMVSLKDGKQVASSAGFLSQVARVAFAPDGSSLAATCTMSTKCQLVLLDPRTLRPLPGEQLLTYDEGEVLVWSPNGAYLAVSELIYGAPLSIVDVQTRKSLTDLRGHPISAAAFSANGTTMTTVDSYQAGVVVWDWQADLRYREPQRTIVSHPPLGTHGSYEPSLELCYSPDGQWLALSCPMPKEYADDVAATAVQFDDSDGHEQQLAWVAKLPKDAAYVFLMDPLEGKTKHVLWSKDNALASKQENRDARVFESIEFSPDGKMLAALLKQWPGYAGNLVVWDTATRRVDFTLEKDRDSWRTGWTDLTFTADSQALLLLPDSGQKEVPLFDLNSSSVVRKLTGYFGKSVVRVGTNRVASGFALWGLDNGNERFRLNDSYAYNHHPLAVAGENAVVGLYDESVAVWNLETLERTYPFAAHRDGGLKPASIAVTKDGQLLATGCADRTIRLWDMASGRLLLKLRGHSGPVAALAFAPDGKTLASASRDGTTQIWKVDDLHQGGPVEAAADLPTRKVFRTANGGEVTVVFDHQASPEEIKTALDDAVRNLPAEAP